MCSLQILTLCLFSKFYYHIRNSNEWHDSLLPLWDTENYVTINLEQNSTTVLALRRLLFHSLSVFLSWSLILTVQPRKVGLHLKSEYKALSWHPKPSFFFSQTRPPQQRATRPANSPPSTNTRTSRETQWHHPSFPREHTQTQDIQTDRYPPHTHTHTNPLGCSYSPCTDTNTSKCTNSL